MKSSLATLLAQNRGILPSDGHYSGAGVALQRKSNRPTSFRMIHDGPSSLRDQIGVILLLIDIGQNHGGTLELSSRRDVEKWAGEQSHQWMVALPADAAVSSELVERIASFAGDIAAYVEEPWGPSIEKLVVTHVAKHRPILVGSPAGDQIVEYATFLTGSASDFVDTYYDKSGLPDIQSDIDKLQAAPKDELQALVEMYLPKAVERAIPNPRKLSNLLESFNAELASLRGQIEVIGTIKNGAVQSFLAALEAANSEHRENLQKRDGEWENAIKTHEERLKLSQTSELWKSRATAHRDARKQFASNAVKAGILSVILTVIASWAAFHFARDILNARSATFATHRLIFGASATVLVLTLGLWITRLLVRLYMTEHHLAIDSDARAALGDTYLSLLADGDAAIDDRKIVLASLFRPVSDGIVNDDALPFISPAAMASGFLATERKPG